MHCTHLSVSSKSVPLEGSLPRGLFWAGSRPGLAPRGIEQIHLMGLCRSAFSQQAGAGGRRGGGGPSSCPLAQCPARVLPDCAPSTQKVAALLHSSNPSGLPSSSSFMVPKAPDSHHRVFLGKGWGGGGAGRLGRGTRRTALPSLDGCENLLGLATVIPFCSRKNRPTVLSLGTKEQTALPGCWAYSGFLYPCHLVGSWAVSLDPGTRGRGW